MVIPGYRNQERLRIGTNAANFAADACANGTLNAGLVFAEKLFPVFDEADQHHDDRPDHAQKKERFKQPNYERGQDHESILAQIWRSPGCFTLAPVCNRFGSRGPQQDFPQSCSSCRSRSPGRWLRGDLFLRGLVLCR